MFLIVSVLLILNFILVSVSISCDYFIAPSKDLGGGRGIYAGTDLLDGFELDAAPTFSFPCSLSNMWQTSHYVYAGSHEDECMLNFGVAMLFNHQTNSNVRYFWSNVDNEVNWVKQYLEISKDNRSSCIVSETTECDSVPVLPVGSELFINYGEGWFESHDMIDEIPHNATSMYSIEELLSTGFCLSDVYIYPTSPVTVAVNGEDIEIPKNNGLFARKKFIAGDIVTISPVLLLPWHEVSTMSSNLINYMFTASYNNTVYTYDVAALPIGYTPLINHGFSMTSAVAEDSRKCSMDVNVELEWYYFSSTALSSAQYDEFERRLQGNVTELMNLPYAVLDIAVRALSNIPAGCEILLDYGLDWENSLLDHISSGADVTSFNKSIDVTRFKLFPDHWRVLSV